MELKTKRLILRPWREEDAERLYRLCRAPEIGAGAGFPPHESPDMSRAVIRDVLSQPETYAVVNRRSGEVIGSASLMLSLEGSESKRPGDAEVGYWIGREYWGWGFATEALGALVRHAGEDLGLRRLWGVIFPGNIGSRRVLEKAGFTLDHREDTYVAQLGLTRETLYFCRPAQDTAGGRDRTTACRKTAGNRPRHEAESHPTK